MKFRGRMPFDEGVLLRGWYNTLSLRSIDEEKIHGVRTWPGDRSNAAPDVKAPEDPWPKQNRSYFVWLYGKPPDVVIEVVSNKEGEELGRKLGIYARIGVPYYVVWDPDQLLGNERLHLFALHAGAYQRHDSTWFPNVNLGVRIWNGVFEDMPADWLRWCYAAGDVVPMGRERAAAAEQRADTAEQELAKVRQRAEKLAALLRSQGIQPPKNDQ